MCTKLFGSWLQWRDFLHWHEFLWATLYLNEVFHLTQSVTHCEREFICAHLLRPVPGLTDLSSQKKKIDLFTYWSWAQQFSKGIGSFICLLQVNSLFVFVHGAGLLLVSVWLVRSIWHRGKRFVCICVSLSRVSNLHHDFTLSTGIG